MKYAIKTSFALVLLCTLLSSAALAKADKNTAETTETEPAIERCSNQLSPLAAVQPILFAAATVNISQMGCDAGIYDMGTGYTVIVTSNCEIYQVGPNGGVTPIAV